MASIALLNEIAELNVHRSAFNHPALRSAMPLGSGCYSSVWADPESEFHVIKCGGGDAWANYAAYCIDNPDNEHLPRISFLKVVNGRYVAQIERLNSIDAAKGPDKKQIEAWCYTLGFQSKDDDDAWLWRYLEDVSNDPLWKTLFQINSTIGRTRDVSYGHNMMMRTDGTLVLTDPIADNEYKGVDKYKLDRFTYDGYVIPERAHSNERYMVRKEVRYSEPSVRTETQDRPLQAEKSIAVCDARTGQVLGLLPQVSGELRAYDGASLPERYTAVQAAQGQREIVDVWKPLRAAQPHLWKIPRLRIASRLHGGIKLSRAAVVAKGGG